MTVRTPPTVDEAGTTLTGLSIGVVFTGVTGAGNAVIFLLDRQVSKVATLNQTVSVLGTTSSTGTVATVLGSVGPSGAGTGVAGWLGVSVSGTSRYIPFW